MKDELKKGQAFIGIDGKKYYFLGLDYNDQVFFTTIDLWSDIEQKYMLKSNIFIKEILNEINPVIENSTWYYQSHKELEKSTVEEKIQRCISIIKNSNSEEIELKPVKIGPLVKGQAYSKEFNQYYEVIGFLIENKVYIDKKFNSYQKGFFAIYHSNCNEQVPLIFERGLNERDNSFLGKSFIAGNNDRVDIQEELISRDIIEKYITEEMKEFLESNNLNSKEKVFSR